MERQTKLANRVTSLLAFALVLGFSLGLLAYVGYGEARRTYPQFEFEKLAAQSELIKQPVETFLLANLPLEQLPGFSPLTAPLLASDKTIAAIYLTDAHGQLLFTNFQEQAPIYHLETTQFKLSEVQASNNDTYKLSESSAFYRLTLELRNKVEKAGELHLVIPRSVIDHKINSLFLYVLVCAVVLMVIYTLCVLGIGWRWGSRSRKWLAILYGGAFAFMSGVVILVLVSLYTGGVEAKTKALANSLAQRLNAPLAMGLQITDFDRIEQTFQAYQKLNPDLSALDLIAANKIIIDTNLNRLGKEWQANPDQFEYRKALTQPPEGKAPLEVLVSIPKSVIFDKLWRCVKNFGVLFIASTLLAGLFFNSISFFGRYPSKGDNLAGHSPLKLRLVGLLYFMGIFAASLTNSFLPQYFEELARRDGADSDLVSSLFTVFFIAYALALLPAGRLAETKLKLLFLSGTFLVAAQLLMLAFFPNFYLMYVVQTMAGLGHGLFFVGVQSYILHSAGDTKLTSANGIIVFGYNGGVISATAIGALLAADPFLGREGVFIIGSVIAWGVFGYALCLIPGKVKFNGKIEYEEAELETFYPAQLKIGSLEGVSKVLRDLSFVKTVVLIAIPTKLILTGLIITSLPLILAHHNYQTEDIGQLIMLYSASVLVANHFLAPLADKTGWLPRLLAVGTLGSGLGLILVGMLAWWGNYPALFPAFVTGLGLVTLGAGHGCIQAPLVTYISQTRTAQLLGKPFANALYRLLERVGNISGPVLVSQLLLSNNQDPVVISWIGGVLVLFGFLFVIRPKTVRTS